MTSKTYVFTMATVPQNGTLKPVVHTDFAHTLLGTLRSMLAGHRAKLYTACTGWGHDNETGADEPCATVVFNMPSGTVDAEQRMQNLKRELMDLGAIYDQRESVLMEVGCSTFLQSERKPL